MTPRLALETQFDFFPGSQPSFGQLQGGRTAVVLAGLRGKFLQSRRFAAYGSARPGVIHFTNTLKRFVVTELPGPPPVILFQEKQGPVTYYALNLSGGVEFYPARRLITRIEFGWNLYRAPDVAAFSNPSPGGGSIGLTVPGGITSMSQLTAGFAYRLGALRENGRESSATGRLEFGPQFTALTLEREGAGSNMPTEQGVGGFLSWRLWRFMHADSALSFFPRNEKRLGPHDGGRVLQGVFGVKAGLQRGRVGIFAKVRPGFHSYSRAVTAITFTPQPFSLTTARATNFVLDLGGVLEVYPTRRTLLRLDLGDTHNYFGTRTELFNGVPVPQPGGRRDTIQFAVGYGWRF